MLPQMNLLEEPVLGRHMPSTQDDDIAVAGQFLCLFGIPSVKHVETAELQPYLTQCLMDTVPAAIGKVGVVGCGADEQPTDIIPLYIK